MNEYFTSAARPREGTSPSWIALDALEPISFLEGLTFRPVLGDSMLVSFVGYEPGVVAPPHSHEEEQITFVLEGELELSCAGESRLLRPGLVAHIPSGFEHSASSGDAPCRAVDIFTPPRRVLAARMRELSIGAGTTP